MTEKSRFTTHSLVTPDDQKIEAYGGHVVRAIRFLEGHPEVSDSGCHVMDWFDYEAQESHCYHIQVSRD